MLDIAYCFLPVCGFKAYSEKNLSRSVNLAKHQAVAFLTSIGKPTTTILLNGHSIKLLSDLYFYMLSLYRSRNSP